MVVSIAQRIGGSLIECRIVIAKFGECRSRGINDLVPGDLNVANSFEYSEGGRPGVGIIAVPCGESKPVPQDTKLMLEFWKCASVIKSRRYF